MNQLTGHIKEIISSGQMSIVTIQLAGQVEMQSLVIDTPASAPYLKEGTPIQVLFKETETIIGTAGHSGLSIENRISGKILEIKKGKLLSRLSINTSCGNLVALISSTSAVLEALTPGMTITAMVKSNEVILAPLA
ncbi:TOBE domain-containing protein [Echinicola rosea]|uniref:Molybdenum-pterin-binding protein n=1 Tax=Echinicola rosea TaxID=1807691 RepID=A0ABQ1UYN6_9BACT|nr:TOBE domain-containing protein [Echinicola rosea]GGF30597.1 molybdenum-pterin-binding protein [Echinicola rosea]